MITYEMTDLPIPLGRQILFERIANMDAKFPHRTDLLDAMDLNLLERPFLNVIVMDDPDGIEREVVASRNFTEYAWRLCLFAFESTRHLWTPSQELLDVFAGGWRAAGAYNTNWGAFTQHAKNGSAKHAIWAAMWMTGELEPYMVCWNAGRAMGCMDVLRGKLNELLNQALADNGITLPSHVTTT